MSEPERAWPKCSIETKPNGSISVAWNGVSLTDDALKAFADERLPKLLATLSGNSVECTVDFSENLLEKGGPIASVLEQLRKATVHVTILKLHRNHLDDEAMSFLANHIKEAAKARSPLMQLHLSDNAVTGKGVRALVMAAHECGGYPRSGKSKLPSLGPTDCMRKALWLRVEKNKVQGAAELLKSLAAAGFPVSLCRSKGEDLPPDAVVQVHPSILDGDEGGKGKGKSEGKGGKGEGKGGKGKAEDKGEGKGKNKGKDELDGKGKSKGKGGGASSGGYKTDICVFYERGICNKGRDCPFAHGKEELQGDGVNTPVSSWNQAEVDVMAWLQEKRHQQGKAGEDFEKRWKAWCAKKGVSNLDKNGRKKCIYEFREECERQAQNSQTDKRAPAEDYWEYFDSNYETHSTNCSASAASSVPKAISVPKKKTQVQDDVDNSVDDCPRDESPEGVWRNGAARVRAKLEKAKCAGALQKCMWPEWTSGSAWHNLGCQSVAALEVACTKRCADMAGTFLDDNGIRALGSLCVGQHNLTATFHALQLMHFLSDDAACEVDNEKRCAVVAAAFAGELLAEGDPNTDTVSCRDARETALKALVDFICVLGLGWFAAHGITSASGEGSKESTAGNEVEEVEEVEENEDEARRRRIQARQQRSDVQWNYTGGYQPADLASKAERYEEDYDQVERGYSQATTGMVGRESNEQATLRMITSRMQQVPAAEKKAPVAKNYKRDMCVFFQNGNCKEGNDCTYAHSKDELLPRSAKSPNDWKEQATAPYEGPSWEAGPPLASSSSAAEEPLPPPTNLAKW